MSGYYLIIIRNRTSQNALSEDCSNSDSATEHRLGVASEHPRFSQRKLHSSKLATQAGTLSNRTGQFQNQKGRLRNQTGDVSVELYVNLPF